MISNAFDGKILPVKAVLFDFDGTLSTLRSGWEEVMKPLMLEMIAGGQEWDQALEAEVDAYIDESTGIQTILQMKWLAQRVHQEGKNADAPDDPWWYKAEYNRRLLEKIHQRIRTVLDQPSNREQFLILGSVAFLQALDERKVRMYIASGTDHPDVLREVDALGLTHYFTQIAGAPVGQENCSKEKVIAQLMQQEGLSGSEFAVIGDGKVEIRLGAEAGARTVGVAANERQRCGVDTAKVPRLVKAGAEYMISDYTRLNDLLAFLGLE